MHRFFRRPSGSCLVSESCTVLLYEYICLIIDHIPFTTILGPKKGVSAVAAARLQ